MFSECKLPNEIWKDKEKAVKLSDSLENKYIDCLKFYDVFDVAEKFDGKTSPIGGVDDKTALEHFACMFVNSGTRVSHIIVDPDRKFSKIQLDIFSTFGTGNISILDLACGTGGHILSLFTTIIELRKNKLIPTLPLNIYIFAADIAPKALEVYEKLLNEVDKELRESDIIIKFTTKIWDATNTSEANRLMNDFYDNTSSIDINEYFVITSAFSGFGGNEENFKKIKRSLQHITERLSDKYSTFLWIEPNTGNSKKFLRWLISIFTDLFSLTSSEKDETIELSNRFSWWEPIKLKVISAGNVSVKLYKRDNYEF